MDDTNLDKLFRDKFKAFREVPDEKVWTAIDRSLNKKRRKRILPLWLQLGGVAAILIIALILFLPTDNAPIETPTVTGTDQKDAKALDYKDENSEYTIGTEGDGRDDANRDGKQGLEDLEQRQNNELQNQESTKKNRGSRKYYQDNGEQQDSIDRQKSNNRQPGRQHRQQQDQKRRLEKRLRVSTIYEEAVTGNSKDETRRVDAPGEDNTKNDRSNQFAQESQLAANRKDNERVDEPLEGHEEMLLGVLEKEAEDKDLAESSRSRWSAGPSIAPVYFNAMGEGSPIDPGFAANGKSGRTNFSYGLSVAYAVTDKLSVRSGIHKIDYGYDTNNVDFSPALDASASGRLENIDYSSGSVNLAVSDATNDSESSNNLAPEFSNSSSTRDGTVAQQFGYLEVPLELDYALIDGTFGVSLVGGVSSLFLIDNSVTLSSGNLSTEIGEASNLNELNFSSNIGFGVNYMVTPSIRLNIEPVFKYQLNTFSNTAGDFRPYSIGVYSGLSYRF